MTFSVALFSLIVVPWVVTMAAFVPDSKLNLVLTQLSVIGFPLWGAFSVWVTLDGSALFRLIGPRPDPVGSKALRLSAVGIVNLAALFLFLVLSKGKQ